MERDDGDGLKCAIAKPVLKCHHTQLFPTSISTRQPESSRFTNGVRFAPAVGCETSVSAAGKLSKAELTSGHAMGIVRKERGHEAQTRWRSIPKARLWEMSQAQISRVRVPDEDRAEVHALRSMREVDR